MNKIPENAKRVFDGVIFDVYQWEQELFDGSTTTFERLKRPNTVNVIPILDNGKILLSQEKQPGLPEFIGVIGGRVDEGEDILTAAKRELLEESGYKAEEWTLWFEIQPEEKVDWNIFTYIAKYCKKIKGQELEAGEQIEPLEVTFDEYMNIILKENYRDSEIALELLKSKELGKLDEVRKLLSL